MSIGWVPGRDIGSRACHIDPSPIRPSDSTRPMPDRLVVVAAALYDDRGRVLLAQRRDDDRHHPGLWEFPGGKVEAGESLPAALARELHEELNLPSEARQWRQIRGACALDRDRRLSLYLLAGSLRRMPRRLEHQALRWVRPVEAARLSLAPLDRQLLRWIAAPRLLAITTEAASPSFPVRSGLGGPGCDAERDHARARPHDATQPGRPDPSRRQVRTRTPALASMQCWQLLRWPGLSDHAYRDALRYWLAAGSDKGRPLLVHNRIDLAALDQVSGVHLSASMAAQFNERPLPSTRWLSVACHNSREIEQARRIDADFVLLAPVRRTATHPAAAALGWPEFRRLVHATDRPVLALGGIRPADLESARQAGAFGVAGIRAFW